MTQTVSTISDPQRRRALERANQVRLARAGLKRRIAIGEVSAADIILGCPAEARSWPVSELLMSQRRWGSTRCRKFLGRNQIGENKPIGELTDRQKRLLATALQPSILQESQRSAPSETQPVTRETKLHVAQETKLHVAQEPVREIVQTPVREIVQAPLREIVQTPVREIVQEPDQEIAEETAGQAAQEMALVGA
jgi:hypothetical protein